MPTETTTLPDDPITSSHAADLLGISGVALYHWRQERRGPKSYPSMKGKLPVFLYSRAECVEYARRRMDVDERLTAVEQALDRLTNALAGAVGG